MRIPRLTWLQQWRHPAVLAAVCSTSITYGAHAKQHVLFADDGTPTSSSSSLPQTKAIFTESPKFGGRRKSRISVSDTQKTLDEQKRAPNQMQRDSVKLKEDQEDENQTVGVEGKKSAWSTVSEFFSDASNHFASIEWASVGDGITNFLLPAWARQLPAFFQKLQWEMDMAPGSLAYEILEDAHDTSINPEITYDADVRTGNDLCKEELVFRRKRKEHMKGALAKYLGVPEDEIHPDDIPIIAMCGSGGGLRALVAGTGSYSSAQEAGLLDCVTYTAGVSGSCWLQALYNSSLGRANCQNIIKHLKNRTGVHIAFPPAALDLITSAPTNKYLLSGFVEKLGVDPDADFGVVDIYGLLLAARLLVPKGELDVNPRNLKLSNQRAYIDDGSNALPIYTAVRHEIPFEEESASLSNTVKEQARREAWFQWFELTPYEFWCEEISAGIPTWSLGRHFYDGHNVLPPNASIQPPEARISLLMGIWGSAFCATLYHYYKEIRPIIISMAAFNGLDQIISERNNELIKVHPIDPAKIPNYVLGMEKKLPSTTPASFFKTKYLQLMDAGMSNNLPIYPLLRPGRNVDIIVAFDNSADIRTENWLRAVDGYARQRDIKGWPIGAGWPPHEATAAQTAQDLEEAQARTPREAESKLEEAQAEGQPNQQTNKTKDDLKNQDHEDSFIYDLSYCNIWVGTSQETIVDREPPPSKMITNPSPLKDPSAGITVIYFPLIPNPDKVPGVDPATSDFMSTWNFIYTPEEIDKVVGLAKANFKEGEERIRDTVRAVWERKKEMREEKDRKSRWGRLDKIIRKEGDSFA
ncbi:MAG: hypothetical protein M1834_007391 [Cirrosporium novae-zelandiae]|nr:MAG: hypothetical protein M1834_007391 [Cirrosporium novae-zelandiae]